MEFSLLKEKNLNPNITQTQIFDKSRLLQKLSPRKDSTDLNQEISLRQKIISNIKKKIESQIVLKNEILDFPIPPQQQSQNNTPKSKNKIKIKIIKDKKNIFLNQKINMGTMALFALGKRKNSMYFLSGKEKNLSSSKNFILSPFKDIIDDEYKKLKLQNNNTDNTNKNKKRDKKYLTHHIGKNSFTPIFNSNIINNKTDNTNYNYRNSDNIDKYKNNIFNKTYYNNDYKDKKIFKRNISWTQPLSSREENKSLFYKNPDNNNHINNQNENNNYYYKYIDKYNKNLQFANWTTRNRNQINLKNNNNNNYIYNSDSKNYTKNNFIGSYNDKKNMTYTNFFNQHSSNKTSDFFSRNITNSNNDIFYFNSTKSKFTNNSSASYINQNSNNNTNNNFLFNSDENKSSKKNIFQKLKQNSNSNSSIFKKIDPKILNIKRDKSQKNVKIFSNKFKNYFYRKVKNLKNITKACKTELIRLIEINNKETEESIKYRTKSKIDKVKKELDIRKDVLDKNSNAETNKLKLKKYKALMNDVKLEMNLSASEEKKTMNLLRKKINIISDSIALNMIEQCLGIKKNVGFDIDELFNEHINKKKDIKKYKMQLIRKKAENNYQKMVKLRHNLTGAKLFHLSSENKKDN